MGKLDNISTDETITDSSSGVANATLTNQQIEQNAFTVISDKNCSSSVKELWLTISKLLQLVYELKEANDNAVDFQISSKRKANEEKGLEFKPGKAIKVTVNPELQLVSIQLYLNNEGNKWVKDYLYTISLECWNAYVFTAENNIVMAKIKKEARKNPIIKLD